MSDPKLKQLKMNVSFVIVYLFLSIVAFTTLVILKADIGPASNLFIVVIIPNTVMLTVLLWTFIGKDTPVVDKVKT